MNRGSALARSLRETKDCRFNEAPIHESGKSLRGSVSRIGSLCFNEAPIHESGK